MGPVYYCLGQPPNIISLDDLKSEIGFQSVISEPLEHFDFVDPQGHHWRSPYKTQNNLDYIQIKVVKINPNTKKDIVVTTVCGISKKNISQLIHQLFSHVFIKRL